LESSATEIKPGPAVAVDEALHVFWRAPHEMLSHSLTFLPFPPESCPGDSPITTSILPCGSIFKPATGNPAATAARRARVTSCCRNVEGARDMRLIQCMSLVGCMGVRVNHPHRN